MGIKYNTDHFLQSVGSYFNFALSVDCVVFGFDNKTLKVLLIKSKMDPYIGQWSLIGDMITTDEELDAAADRILEYRTGLKNVFLKQVKAFGQLHRHPLGRVVTIAYVALVRIKDYEISTENMQNEAHWHHVTHIPSLAFDHNEILDYCLNTLRKKIREEPVGFTLLPDKFTIFELQSLYESILNEKIDKRNFRKKILSMQILEPCNEIQKGVPHRPAKLYRFNRDKYKELRRNGWVFALNVPAGTK